MSPPNFLYPLMIPAKQGKHVSDEEVKMFFIQFVR